MQNLTYTDTIIGGCGPFEEKTAETEEFCDELQAVLENNNQNEYVVLAGDFNVRVGSQPLDKHIESKGKQAANNNGRDLINFNVFNKLKNR